MRRADRLFEILLWLRRKPLVTAKLLAGKLEVSERTIYRDIADLAASGVPIDGEAGIGYRLRPGFQLPPLMFTREELTALRIGARMVEGWADSALARAAGSAVARIEAVLPERLSAATAVLPVYAPDFVLPAAVKERFGILRAAIETRRVVELEYRDREAHASRRCVEPLGLLYWGAVWTLAAWCRMRTDFRTFRLDRIHSLTVLDCQFEIQPGRDLHTYCREAGRDD